MEINIARMEEKIDNIIDKLSENTQQHADIYTALKSFDNAISKKFENLESKYASKYVEKIVWIVLTAMILGCVGALFHLAGVA